MIVNVERYPGFQADAVFSDGTAQFVSPAEPEIYDTVTLKIRTAVNFIDEVNVIADGRCYPMHVVERNDAFLWHAAEVALAAAPVSYLFQLRYENEIYYYDRFGVNREPRMENRFMITPGFHTPDWAKGAVMYQIFVDRFYNGDPTNDVATNEYFYIDRMSRECNDWNEYPSKESDVAIFHGGDLAGVWKKLDYLQELGVEVIYLNPIFVSPSNHKYDNQDYDYIDPHYGVIVKDAEKCLEPWEKDNNKSEKYVTRVTSLENLEASNDFFAHFVEEVHRRGMKVIIDGVFNHCGSFNKWLDREGIYSDKPGFLPGAYQSADSPYRDFFDFKDTKQEAWPHNNSYDGWWGHNTLPKLNYEESPNLYNYIMRIARKWVSPPYNCDGWRLDVAADLGHSPEFNHRFWKDFRKNVRAANPNALILAEHYGDAGSWLQGDEWDSVMNYDAFMEPVTWFLTGMQKHSDEFRTDMLCNDKAFVHAMNHYMARFQTPSMLVAMNELSNHDHSRFLTRTNRRVGRIAHMGPQAAERDVDMAVMREAVLMQMTWMGAPTVYYGDEAGLCGWTDPDNRRAFPWGHENKELQEFHREAIRIHRDYKALKTGSLKMLHTEPGVLTYGRFDEKDTLVVAINNNDQERVIRVPVWQLALTDDQFLVRLIRTDHEGFGFESEIYHIVEGEITLIMPPRSGVVLKNMRY